MLLDPRALWTREEVGQYLGKIDVKTVDRLIATRLPPNVRAKLPAEEGFAGARRDDGQRPE